MKIPEIKRNLTLETVLGYYKLQPDKNNRLNCPWHPDKTPSLQIYPKTNSWTCFSSNCDAGSGDVIDFIMKFEKITKYEAIQKATALVTTTTVAAPPVQKTTPQSPVEIKEIQTPLLDRVAALNKVFDYFKSGIRRGSPQIKQFLEERGLDLNLLSEVGYNSAQIHQRENKQYIESYLAIHLLTKNPSGGYRVFAKNCVIFPLKNQEGQIVSLYGRSIASTSNSKHYYLKNTQGLYPSYPPKNTKKLIITESIIDAATLLQCPKIIKEYCVLAAYGTNRLTQEHLEAIGKLKNLTEATLWLDGDDAGRKAVAKYAQELHFLLPNVTISYVNTPEEEDINSLYTTYDSECLETLINECKISYNPSTGTGITTQTVESINAPKFNSSNHEALTYETKELDITVLGGIKISGLERMKVTLKIQVRASHYAPLRQILDLYNNDQLTRLVRTLNEQLDVQTETARQALLDLIEQLENYRINRINQMQPQQVTSTTITPHELTSSESYLKEKNLMERTMEDLGKTGIVGEINNRIIMYLVFLSRITDEPLHIISFGASGTGKTHLQDGIAKLLPEEAKLEITSISGNALYYLQHGEIAHKVLIIEDMDGAQEVLYPLRELQTKQKITKRVSIKDSKGTLKTITITVFGPVCIAGCTTKNKIYEDNANRSILIYIDGSADQDERIMAYQRAASAGQINKEEELKYQQILRNVQRTLKPIKVVNPYAPDLKIPLKTKKKRRINGIYLRFIEIITLYHQYQRTMSVDKNTGEHFIETTIEDIAWANQLIKDVLLRKADELSDPSRHFFERIKKWLKDHKKEQFKTAELRVELQVSASSLKRYLPELLNCGHLKITGGNKTRGYTYEVTSYEEYQKLKHSIDHLLDKLLDQIKRKKEGVIA